MFEAFEKQKEFDKALDAYKKYIVIRDSKLNDDKKQEIVRREMQYEFDKEQAILKADQFPEFDRLLYFKERSGGSG